MPRKLTFAEQVRRERLRAGLSQSELARKLKCPTETVSRWERGVTTPRLMRFKRGLKRLLGVEAS